MKAKTPNQKESGELKRWQKALIVIVPVLVLSSAVLLEKYGPFAKASGKSAGLSSDTNNVSLWTMPDYPNVELSFVTHTEDEAITFSDIGMEERVRLWTGIEEGEIQKSDIWNIHSLTIELKSSSNTTTDYVSFIEEDSTDARYASDNQISYDTTGMTAIESLEDLRYFENLQSLSLRSYNVGGRQELDLTGLESVAGLEYLHMKAFSLSGTEAIESLENLVTLRFESCADIEIPDLSKSENLTVLQIRETGIDSLSALNGLPIKILYVQYSMASIADTPGLDYTVLGSLKKLETLNLNGIDDLTAEDLYCLQNLENLRELYLMETGLTNKTTQQSALEKALTQVDNIYYNL